MVSPTTPPPRFDRGARRIVACGLATVSGVVLLFSYRTSTSAEIPAQAGSSDTPDTGTAQAVVSSAGAPDAGTSDTGSSDAGTSDTGSSDPGSPDVGATNAGGVDPGAAAAAAAGPTVGRASTSRAWSGTVTGPVVPIRWGEVQVRATLAQGRITAVDVLRAPDENARDQQVNARAVPVLVRETLAAQSTRIDMVSGATFTSTGYVQSLQAALDRTGTA